MCLTLEIVEAAAISLAKIVQTNLKTPSLEELIKEIKAMKVKGRAVQFQNLWS